MKQLIFAVDFDGTLSNESFPKCGKPALAMIEACKNLQAKGHCIVLNTCRHDKELEEAISWLATFGLRCDYVNENQKELVEKYGDCRKIGADFYIDDKNLSFEAFIAMSQS